MGNMVSAAKPAYGGAVSMAPAGTTLPSDATTSLGAAFTKLGYISDSGMTNSNTINTDTVKAWGGDEVLVTYNGRNVNFKFAFLESMNANVLKLIYGAENVTGSLSTGIAINAKSNIELPEQVFVIDMIMKDNTKKRIVIPAGRISNVGDITYVDNNAIMYEVTIIAIPDASGNTHYEYIHGATGATGASGANG